MAATGSEFGCGFNDSGRAATELDRHLRSQFERIWRAPRMSVTTTVALDFAGIPRIKTATNSKPL